MGGAGMPANSVARQTAAQGYAINQVPKPHVYVPKIIPGPIVNSSAIPPNAILILYPTQAYAGMREFAYVPQDLPLPTANFYAAIPKTHAVLMVNATQMEAFHPDACVMKAMSVNSATSAAMTVSNATVQENVEKTVKGATVIPEKEEPFANASSPHANA
jgi:hypothetical protein